MATTGGVDTDASGQVPVLTDDGVSSVDDATDNDGDVDGDDDDGEIRGDNDRGVVQDIYKTPTYVTRVITQTISVKPQGGEVVFVVSTGVCGVSGTPPKPTTGPGLGGKELPSAEGPRRTEGLCVRRCSTEVDLTVSMTTMRGTHRRSPFNQKGLSVSPVGHTVLALC